MNRTSTRWGHHPAYRSLLMLTALIPAAIAEDAMTQAAEELSTARPVERVVVLRRLTAEYSADDFRHLGLALFQRRLVRQEKLELFLDWQRELQVHYRSIAENTLDESCRLELSFRIFRKMMEEEIERRHIEHVRLERAIRGEEDDAY